MAVKQIAAGFRHTCAIQSDSTPICWGAGDDGQTTIPEGLGTVKQIAAGYSHTCAIKSDNTAVCWGLNDDGQTITPEGIGTVKQIRAEGYHSCAIKNDSTPICWGANDNGQLIRLDGSTLGISAPINLIDSVNLREGPGSTYPRVGGITKGTSPSFNCWSEGKRIGNVNVWFNVTVNGVTGFYSSYFDNSHYGTNSQITSKYGIPHCPGPPQPGSEPITGAAKAIAWMSGRLGYLELDQLSLSAVSQAYMSAGIDITAGLATKPSHDTAFSFWRVAGDRRHPGERNPPRGALLFFRSAAGAPGHVAIALNSTYMLTTADGRSAGIHVAKISSYYPSRYLGWANPQ